MRKECIFRCSSKNNLFTYLSRKTQKNIACLDLDLLDNKNKNKNIKKEKPETYVSSIHKVRNPLYKGFRKEIRDLRAIAQDFSNIATSKHLRSVLAYVVNCKKVMRHVMDVTCINLLSQNLYVSLVSRNQQNKLSAF